MLKIWFCFFWNTPALLLIFPPLFWAGNITLGRFIAGHVPPFALTYVRWTGACLILLPFAWRYLKRDWGAIKATWFKLCLFALTGLGAYNAMAYIGLSKTTALNGLLLQSTGPMLIAFWSFILYKDTLNRKQAIGIVLSMLGAVTIITQAQISNLLHLNLNSGDIWIASAMVLYGLYSAMLRNKPAMHDLSFLCITMSISSLMLLPLWSAEMVQGIHPIWDAKGIAAALYVMTFPAVLAYLCFNRGVELVGPNRAAPYFHLMPVFGSLIAILLLGEKPEAFHAAGYALVIAGIVLASRKAAAAEV